MKKIYGTYRPERLVSPYSLGDVTLNGTYNPGMFLNAMFGDWNAAGLTNVIDSLFGENLYTKELVPGVPKLTRFMVCEYDENHVDPAEFDRSVKNCGARWDIDTFATVEEARQWVRNNVVAEETVPGTFVSVPEHQSAMTGETVPAKLVIVD